MVELMELGVHMEFPCLLDTLDCPEALQLDE